MFRLQHRQEVVDRQDDICICIVEHSFELIVSCHQVSVLLGLIKEVTGVGLNAFYKPTAESLDTAAAPASTNDTPSRSQQLTMAKLPRSGLPWQMMGGFGHSLRRVFIR